MGGRKIFKGGEVNFSPLKTQRKDKVQLPQQNEMLSPYFTALGFNFSKNEEYTILNKIPNGRYFKS